MLLLDVATPAEQWAIVRSLEAGGPTEADFYLHSEEEKEEPIGSGPEGGREAEQAAPRSSGLEEGREEEQELEEASEEHEAGLPGEEWLDGDAVESVPRHVVLANGAAFRRAADAEARRRREARPDGQTVETATTLEDLGGAPYVLEIVEAVGKTEQV